ncbi:hypothetical protein Harreka1_18 [Olleya phage Harreka_1]|uniref:Uncharacterized protein n=1 Tax=Olleya phage Harreka_1 TaxID=2745673 RepID=A0A8E4ZLQ0_9CAUD|nr:hypothetical protein M1M26_gp18 [Olleya phage Harreka_1]QQV90425.1 hypothetical protein Harreka1_18 [Olleya phage Harreka_1]
MFVKYLIKNDIANKLYMLGFCVAVMSYSFWKQGEDVLNFSKENEGALFFIGIAFSFCCYTSAYMFTKWDKWRYFPMVAFLICVSRFIKEIYMLYYPDLTDKYDYFDYFNLLLSFWIIFNYYVKIRFQEYKTRDKYI